MLVIVMFRLVYWSFNRKEIPEEQSNAHVENKLTMPWLKMKKTNRQTIVHMIQQIKLNNKQHEPQQKLGVISGAPGG